VAIAVGEDVDGRRAWVRPGRPNALRSAADALIVMRVRARRARRCPYWLRRVRLTLIFLCRCRLVDASLVRLGGCRVVVCILSADRGEGIAYLADDAATCYPLCI